MKILFKRDRGFGDAVLLSGCIRETKRKYPESEIVLQTLFPEVAGFIPEIDMVVNYNIEADVVCDMNMVYEKQPKTPVWKAYANMLFKEYKDADIMPAITCDYKLKEKPFEKYVVIHPCKSSPSRTLSKQKWDDVVEYFYMSKIPTIVVGSVDDFGLDRADIDLRGKLSLKEIYAYIDKADAFIGLDSGIMHIAMGTQTPVVGIFSVASPGFRVWREDKTTAICPTSDCRFCLSRLKPTESVNCDKLDCIKSITAKDIIDGVSRYV